MAKRVIKEIDVKESNDLRTRRKQIDVRREEHGIGKGCKKPRALIRMSSVDSKEPLDLLDRKIINLLQEKIVRDIKAEGAGEKIPDVKGYYSVNISDISAMTGINDYSEVRARLAKLDSCSYRYDMLEEESNKLFDGVSSFFSREMEITGTAQGDGEFRFSFPKSVMDLFREPQAYAFINISNIFAFSSKYSIALYENLALHLHMKDKTWTVSVSNLLDLMGYPYEPGDKVDFGKFRTKAIEPAMNEINGLGELSAFSVRAEYNKDVHTFKNRKISSVTFRIQQNYDNKKTGNSYSDYTGLNPKQDDKNSGFNISSRFIGDMIDRYHADLGQASRYETAVLLLKIWQLRVMENKRICDDKDMVCGLELEIMRDTYPHSKPEKRDATFVKVIEREAAYGWNYSVPQADQWAIERIKGRIETLDAPAAHEVSEAPTTLKAVAVDSISRKGMEKIEDGMIAHANEVRNLYDQAEELGLELDVRPTDTEEDLQAIRAYLEEQKLKLDVQRKLNFMQIVNSVSDGDLPVRGKVLETTESDDIPFD